MAAGLVEGSPIEPPASEAVVTGPPEGHCLVSTKAPRLDLAATGKRVAHRISPRLAIKSRGVKKSSLLKAQDLINKKLKMVRFVTEIDRFSALPGSPAISMEGLRSATPTVSGSPTTAAPSESSPPDVAPSPRSDLLSPLTLAETLLIKAACGIIDSSNSAGGASSSAGPSGM